MTLTKLERSKAYAAGRAAHNVQWPEGTPDEVKAPGLHHCPFAEGDPQREEWLKGYAEVIEEQRISPTIVRQINDELKVTSDVS